MMDTTAPKVVITGRALNTPLGNDLEHTFRQWQAGVGTFTLDEFGCEHGALAVWIGECNEFDLSLLPDRKVLKAIGRKDKLGLTTALAAARDAGLSRGLINPERIGMFIGASSTQLRDLHHYQELLRECMQTGNYDSHYFGERLLAKVSPMAMLQTLMNNTLCYASMALDVRGVNNNFMDFQIAGLRALHEGAEAIRSRRADVVIVGGIAGRPEPFHATDGVESGYLARSTADSDPHTLAKPFDCNREGGISSEGAAFLVIESEAHAIKRGAAIYGEVGFVNFASEGSFSNQQSVNSRALTRCMKEAMRKVSSSDPLLVMAHASGAVHGDAAEANSYLEILPRQDWHIHASKSVFGDMGEASALVDCVLALEAMQSQVIPGTKNFSKADESISELPVSAQEKSIHSQNALITARSFSGCNAAVVVRRYPN